MLSLVELEKVLLQRGLFFLNVRIFVYTGNTTIRDGRTTNKIVRKRHASPTRPEQYANLKAIPTSFQ